MKKSIKPAGTYPRLGSLAGLALAAAAAAPALAQTNPYLLTYDLRVDGTGAKEATVHDVGDIVTLDLFAHVYGTDADLTNEAFQSTFGSFESSNGGILGDLVGLAPPAPFNATYQTGLQNDLDGDRDLDLGSLGTAYINYRSPWYFARSATLVPSDPDSDLFIGQVRFIATSLSGNSTQVNWITGTYNGPAFPQGAVIFSDGAYISPEGPGGLLGTDPRVHTGAPVTISVGDSGTPGTDTLLSNMTLPAGQPTYDWSTGNLIVSGPVQINSGGTFHQTGGTASFNATNNTINGAGVLQLDGGTLNGNLITVTGGTPGGISQTAGAANISYLYLKSSADVATYTLQNGSLSSTAIIVGSSSVNGHFQQNGGSVNVAQSLQMNTTASTAEYELNNGQLQAAYGVIAWSGVNPANYPGAGSVIQTGGAATFGSLSIGAHGAYTLSGGSLTINKTLKNYGTIDLANSPVTLTAGPTSFLDFSKGQF